ncbi:MAG: thioredoxin family protein [Candidatus Diapherotrites archaeon]|nr:thioredoxin family protein [Candidatus Diapherotrites archaeon]
MALTSSSYKVLQRDSPAPGFSLPGIDGKTHSLKDFADRKAFLVVFMCNHCPYVQPKISKLVELHEKHAQKGLGMIGINCNDVSKYPDDSFENMKRFSMERGIKFPYLLDESQQSARSYGATCTPDPFLFDARQMLAYHGRIDDAHGQPHSMAKTNELEEAIQQTLAGKEVTIQTLPSMGCNIKWK